MAAMRVKRMRRVWQVLGTLAVEVAQGDCPGVVRHGPREWAKGGTLPAGVYLYGSEGPELECVKPAREIEVRPRPWLQRFVRSYCAWREHLGVVQSLRAAWAISRIPLRSAAAAAVPRSRSGRDPLDVSGGQLSEG